MADGIRLLETLVLKGPNFWSYRPCIWMRIDLGPFRDRPTDAIAGFHDRLLALLPSLQEHHCSEGAAGGFLKRVREGTWLGHVAEHAAIEVQRLVGIPVSFGRTRETRTPGVYNLVYEMEEERVGVRAGKLALDVVEHCAGIYGEAMDLEQRLDGLKRLREKWALGPSTKSIVDTAAARGIPWLRLNDRSLRMLGYGVNQRKIQGHDRFHHRPPRGGDRGGQGPHQAPPGRPGGARPQGRSHGRGVLTNIRSERELRQAYQEARKHREEN